jgi:hypothetical protein
MRSVNAPRVPHDATVEIGDGHRARAVNLSTGGIFVSADENLDPGAQVHLKVNLRDGASPLDVDAEVVRRADRGLALRFVELDDVARRRIQRLVHKREPTQFGKRDVRIHLPSLAAPLRATARDLTERGVMIEAELPWLRLGSPVTTELSSDRACDGRVQWIGLDVTRSGSARLRIFVDLTEERADGTPAGPPPAVVAADDALQLRGDDLPRRAGRLGWLWPTLAVGGLLATGVLSAALLRAPPVPTLLPTAPPEREARIAHLPARTTLAREPDEATATAMATPTATATATGAAAQAVSATTTAAPASVPASAATVRPAASAAHKRSKASPRKATHAKKHARITPRAG